MSVPPEKAYSYPHPKRQKRVVEEERVGTCDACEAGTVYDRTLKTGVMHVYETFDDDEEEYEGKEHEVRCDYCGAGYYY